LPLRRLDFVQRPKDRVRVVLHPDFGNRARRPEPHGRVLFRPEEVLERLYGSARQRPNATHADLKHRGACRLIFGHTDRGNNPDGDWHRSAAVGSGKGAHAVKVQFMDKEG
jgi:hypothetical protein